MANDDPILPTLGQVIGKGKEALVAARPSAAPHVESGRYATVFAGWRAQFAIARSYQAKQVRAARLPTAEGQELTELAQSEYDCPRNTETTRAVGEVILRRKVVHYVAGAEIATADATDGASVEALLEAIRDAVNEHILSEYSAASGLGAHQEADGSPELVLSTADMTALVSAANSYKLQVNRHFANLSVTGGVAGGFHKDTDTANVIATADATASDGGASFDGNTTASQTSLLTLVNAIKAAFNAHVVLESKAGTVRAGTVFRVDPAPGAIPPVTGGEYRVTVDTYAAVGSQTISPPIEATVEGPAPNLPLWAIGGPALTIKSVVPLFDSGATLAFAVSALLAAGGGSGQGDPELRRAAAAAWTGRYGPTAGALTAGALQSPGVTRLQVPENTVRGGSVCYAGDVSWAWSQRFADGVERELRDDWLGQGCRLSSGRVTNQVVRIEATVALRDADLLVDPSAITAALQKVCRAYFDDRPDWHIWRTSTLRAVLSRASRSILRCSEVRVLDHVGRPITEPDTVVLGVGAAPDMVHWVFADSALLTTYTGPS